MEALERVHEAGDLVKMAENNSLGLG